MVFRSSPSRCNSARSFKTERNAAKVFPVPVGDTIRTFAPSRILGQASRCAGVGSAYLRANHSVTSDGCKSCCKPCQHATEPAKSQDVIGARAACPHDFERIDCSTVN